ncbi:MAG TPA: hypothetical protein DEA08_04050 [Planctomycetes bacterium]|nr:hypothetical protein [Planctomycetota bacterium]
MSDRDERAGQPRATRRHKSRRLPPPSQGSLRAIKRFRATCLPEVLEEALAAAQLPRGAYATRCPRTGKLDLATTRGFEAPNQGEERKALMRIMRAAASVHGPQVRLGVSVTHREDLSVGVPGLGAVLACPILFQGKVVGAVAVEDPAQNLPPKDDTLDRLQRALSNWAEALSIALRLRAEAAKKTGAPAATKQQAPAAPAADLDLDFDFGFSAEEVRRASLRASARHSAILPE